MPFTKKIFFIYGAIFTLVLIFALGWFLGSSNETPVPVVFGQDGERQEAGAVVDKNSKAPAWLTRDVEFDIFWEVWQKIQGDFVDKPVAEPELFYGALKGLVASLGDPYSVFLVPQDAESFTEELAGRFEGIGAEIGIKNERLTIISPLPESPAEQAGLRGGDRVFSIDGFDTTGISLNEAVNRIRGEKGTPVTLTVLSLEATELKDIEITRDTIKIVSVTHEIKQTLGNKNIGLIKVTSFHADTSGRFRESVNDLLSSGVDGFIVDLRNNPGGFLDKAIDLSSYWVASGDVVVMEKLSNDNIKTHLSSGTSQLKDFPTVVLVNGGSASGSEIMAGALQDHGLAVLVGEKTFGKGSVQDLTDFRDGSALKLTIAKWLTPNGSTIDAEGIEPDETIELTEEDYNADIDPQLDRALEILDQ